MLTAITIENFKGISAPVRLDLRPITMLFGQNSAGKSSLLHALLYAREIVEGRNLDAQQTRLGGPLFDLGGFRTMVHGHDRSKAIKLTFALNLQDVDLPVYATAGVPLQTLQETAWDVSGVVTSAEIELEIAWNRFEDAVYVRSYSVTLNEMPFAVIQCEAQRHEVFLTYLDLMHPVLAATGMADELPERYQTHATDAASHWGIAGQPDALPHWWQPLDLRIDADLFAADQTAPELARAAKVAFLSRLIVGPGELLRDVLKQFRYIGPQRQVPHRDYRPTMHRNDRALWANGLAGWDLLFRQPALVEQVSQLLADTERFNLGYTLDLVTSYELEQNDRVLTAILANQAEDVEHLDQWLRKAATRQRLLFRPLSAPDVTLEPADLGVGVSQMIPVLAAALDTQLDTNALLPTQLVAIEHPELNLHPRLQAEMADVFLEGALAEATAGRIFFIETHSEVLPLRLFRRIRETTTPIEPDEQRRSFDFTIRPRDVGVWYVERRHGPVTVTQLKVDINGEWIQPWPDDDTLFEQDFKERYA